TPTHALNAHDVRSQLAINLLAPIWLTRKLLPGMIDRKSGLIVNMASAAGERPSRNLLLTGQPKRASYISPALSRPNMRMLASGASL
ncbi:MAG: hypothetical protein DME38_13925, partial [Verrucomicrobia bacterium]